MMTIANVLLASFKVAKIKPVKLYAVMSKTSKKSTKKSTAKTEPKEPEPEADEHGQYQLPFKKEEPLAPSKLPSRKNLRNILKAKYKNMSTPPVCVITGCQELSILEACHIQFHALGGLAEPQNAIWLRKDMHRLFDNDCLRIDKDGEIYVSTYLQKCIGISKKMGISIGKTVGYEVFEDALIFLSGKITPPHHNVDMSNFEKRYKSHPTFETNTKNKLFPEKEGIIPSWK